MSIISKRRGEFLHTPLLKDMPEACGLLVYFTARSRQHGLDFMHIKIERGQRQQRRENPESVVGVKRTDIQQTHSLGPPAGERKVTSIFFLLLPETLVHPIQSPS